MAEGQASFEVLSTKVEFQGKQLEQLADETARQLVSAREENKQQLAGLRNDFKTQFDKLGGSLDNLFAKLETNSKETANSGRVNWFSLVGTGVSAVAVSAALLGGIATLRLTPIENDVKAGKEAQTQIVAALDRVVGKLDNYESRAEITERNARIDAALADGKSGRSDLEKNKVSKSDLDGLLHERDTDIARLRGDIKSITEANEKQSESIVVNRIDIAKIEVRQELRSKELDRIIATIDKLPTTADTQNLKDRIQDFKDRVDLLSGRVQTLFDKNYASPKYPCLDSGAGCGPIAPSGPQVQPLAGGH